MPNLNDHYILEQIRKSRHIHIFSGAVLMKIREPVVVLQKFFTIKEFSTNWIFGATSGLMTGTRGDTFYLITSQQGFRLSSLEKSIRLDEPFVTSNCQD
jgi:hypothetical protein